ncbi:conserved hypothetical protein, partial [Ricinus communis]
LALRTHFPCHARHLGRERRQLFHHRVRRGRRAQVLALQRVAVHFQRHRLRQIAFRDGADDARHFRRRAHEVVDQRIDRADDGGPAAHDAGHGRALRQVAFAADDARHLGDRLDHLFLGLDDVVQGIGDLAGHAGPVGRHAYREVAFFQRHQRGQQQLDIKLFSHVGHVIH